MQIPKLACCNFISDTSMLKDFALEHEFDGVEWSFFPETLPLTLPEEEEIKKQIEILAPLEVRYHAAYPRLDVGHSDEFEAEKARKVFEQTCRLVSLLGGTHLTIHLGLGHDSTLTLSWDRTIKGIRRLKSFSDNLGVTLCLENLAWGWTSKPHIFERLLRKTGLNATLDIGHALVSPAVSSGYYDIEDFLTPFPNRFVGAHIYDEESDDQHHPPENLDDVEERLSMLKRLPRCNWWVLELREEGPLLKTLAVVREYLRHKFILGNDVLAPFRR